MRAALLFVLVALAGCTAPSTPPPGEAADPAAGAGAARVLPWGLESCRFVIGLVRFDPAQAQDLLPEGFAFATGDGLPLPTEVEPLQQATLGVEAFACERGAGLNGTVEPLAYGSFYFNVVPPPELGAGEDAGHYLKLDVLVPDAPRRAVLEGAGATVHDGTVELTDGPAGREAAMTLDGIGDVRITSTAAQPNEGFEGFRFREFTPARDGLVRWDAVASSPGTFSGRGLLEVPAGSLPARLGGGERLTVAMFGGTYTFTDGTITLPEARRAE